MFQFSAAYGYVKRHSNVWVSKIWNPNIYVCIKASFSKNEKEEKKDYDMFYKFILIFLGCSKKKKRLPLCPARMLLHARDDPAALVGPGCQIAA